MTQRCLIRKECKRFCTWIIPVNLGALWPWHCYGASTVESTRQRRLLSNDTREQSSRCVEVIQSGAGTKLGHIHQAAISASKGYVQNDRVKLPNNVTHRPAPPLDSYDSS